MSAKRRETMYPQLVTPLPPHLHARLHAASTVLGTPVERLVENALITHFATLDEVQRELIDRVAASLLVRSELEPDGE